MNRGNQLFQSLGKSYICDGNVVMWNMPAVIVMHHVCIDLQAALNDTFAWPYSAAVVFADHGAVDFFKNVGFLEDPVLAHKYRWVVLCVEHTLCRVSM